MTRNYTNKSIAEEYNTVRYYNVLTNPIQQSTNERIQHNSDLGYINTKGNNSEVIDGYFPKENLVRAMAIKKVNKTLCGHFVSIISFFGFTFTSRNSSFRILGSFWL